MPEPVVVEVFHGALIREGHNVSRLLDLLWQQLFNRLQWGKLVGACGCEDGQQRESMSAARVLEEGKMPQAARTFRIFVSSTFEDLKEERNALQERVFPELKALCLGAPNVRAHVDGHEIIKEIVVPGKLVNVVVRS